MGIACGGFYRIGVPYRRACWSILAERIFPFAGDVVEQQCEETAEAVLRVGARVEVDGDRPELGDGPATVL